jgi:hypothetical protein
MQSAWSSDARSGLRPAAHRSCRVSAVCGSLCPFRVGRRHWSNSTERPLLGVLRSPGREGRVSAVEPPLIGNGSTTGYGHLRSLGVADQFSAKRPLTFTKVMTDGRAPQLPPRATRGSKVLHGRPSLAIASTKATDAHNRPSLNPDTLHIDLDQGSPGNTCRIDLRQSSVGSLRISLASSDIVLRYRNSSCT